MRAKKKTEFDSSFDAVAESRRWKEAVARETAGMSTGERMNWFRSQSSVSEIRAQAKAAIGEMVLREGLTFYGKRKH